MTRTQVLQHNAYGYVAFDTVEELFEVAFQTTVLKLDAEELNVFAHALEERLATYRGTVCPGAKLFVFDNGNAAIRLVLCFAEMDVLSDMVEEALMTHAVNEVMGSLP